MKNYTFITLLGVFIFLFNVNHSNATIFFAWDGEAKSYNADTGTGNFSYLGGKASGSEGTGCSSTSTSHNTIISNDAAAQSSIPGSSYSLKTPYDGNCPNESFSRDTTIITLASDVKEVYIRLYQKFTGDWNSASVQHKFSKFTPKAHAGDDNYATGYFKFGGKSKRPFQGRLRNVDGQFDTNIKRHSVCGIYMSEAGAGSQYEGGYRYWDNYNNKLGDGDTDAEFYFKTNIWYCIEMHVKVNSNSSTADAVLEMWVDGKKIFSLNNFKFFGANDPAILGVGTFELQHIYYNRSGNDQPTYMDNIVIADQYIGPVGSADIPAPAAPAGFMQD